MITGQLTDVMKAAIAQFMTNIHTAFPGIVTKYDAQTKKVAIQPAIKLAFTNQDEISSPALSDVPVMFPGSSDTVIQYPLKKGDTGLVICSERSLEQWLISTGGEASPGDPRRYSMTDAMFIPGLFPFNAPGKLGQQLSGLEIVYKGVEIQIDDNGKIKLGGDTKQFVTYTELNAALQTFLTALKAAIASGCSAGSGASIAAVTLDISASKSIKTLLGG